MRIRARLALYGAFVTAVAMLVFGLLLSWLARQSGPVDQDKELAAIAQQLVSEIDTLEPSELSAIAPLARADLATSTEPFIVVLESDGTVVYTNGHLDGLRVTTSPTATSRCRTSRSGSSAREARLRTSALPSATRSSTCRSPMPTDSSGV